MFQKAFNTTITASNIKRSFKEAKFIPMNLQNVISKLDVKLAIPQSSKLFSCETDFWVSKTLQKPIEASSQSEYIKNQIIKHQNSSFNSFYNAVNQLAKNVHEIMHKLAFLKEKNAKFQETNQILNQRRKAKKT